jgi:hypothetical protein
MDWDFGCLKRYDIGLKNLKYEQDNFVQMKKNHGVCKINKILKKFFDLLFGSMS